MKKLFFLLFTCLVLVSTSDAKAVSPPLDEPNNRFGIHIIDENDLKNAKELVNSSGGKWGYVTMVIREDERDINRWQRIFDKLRENSLIPIIRLATTVDEDGNWDKPNVEDANEWAAFLGSLNWVIENRYVILFNEPNHAKEWGGEVNPKEYVEITKAFIENLKGTSLDFYILPAGFDASAPNSSQTLSVQSYFDEMYKTDNNIFTLYDGWTSHSYPNPGFSGSPDDTGKTSIQGYKWEINYLSQYGLPSNIPTFITETGWSLSDEDILSEYYKKSYESVWDDPQIVAVTPFVLSYLSKPFSQFSWLNPETGEFRKQFNTVKNMPKLSGDPKAIMNSNLTSSKFPTQLSRNATYDISIYAINTGQSIWSPKEYSLRVEGLSEKDIAVETLKETPPGKELKINVRINTYFDTGDKTLNITLEKNGEKFGQTITKDITIKSIPAFLVKSPIDLYPTKSSPKEYLGYLLNN